MKAAFLKKEVLVNWKRVANKTDEDIAVELGVHAITVSKYLNGHRAIPTGLLIALEQYTGIPQGDLVDVVDVPSRLRSDSSPTPADTPQEAA